MTECSWNRKINGCLMKLYFDEQFIIAIGVTTEHYIAWDLNCNMYHEIWKMYPMAKSGTSENIGQCTCPCPWPQPKNLMEFFWKD